MDRGRSPARRGKGESGAAMVEFALVVGLFAFMLYGLVTFGMVLAAKQKVTNAAADAARATVGATNITDAQTLAQARVIAELGAAGATYTATYVPEVACVAPAACIRVTIKYKLPASPGLGLVVPNDTTSTAVVQYS